MDELVIKFNHLDEQKKINKRHFARISDISADTLYSFIKGLDVSQRTRRKIERGIKILEGTRNAQKPELTKKIQGGDRMDDDRLIEMARLILGSGTEEAAALRANIFAFHKSLTRFGHSAITMPIEDPQEKGPGGSS